MKTSENLLVLPEGKARFYPKIKAKGRWKLPDVPEYDPNWLVRFNVLGKSWLETADGIPLAMGLRPVRAWAKERILTEAALIMEGKLETLRQLRAPQKVVMLDEVLRVHDEHSKNLDERRRYGARLTAIATEMTGLPVEAIPVTDAVFSNTALVGWMRMRQEHSRRGYTATKKPPADAWVKLRADLAAGLLPGLDMHEALPCNTTIRNYLKDARNVFAYGRRFLPGLNLPDLKDLMNFKHGLNLPSGHREIPEEVVEKVWTELPALRVRCERAWLFFQILAWTGARPEQIKGMTAAHVSWEPDGYALLMIPAAKGGDAVNALLPAEFAEVLRKYMGPDGLLGGYLDRVHYKTMNPWLRERGMKDTHVAYLLRHRRLQMVRDQFGEEKAATAGGHRGTAMVRKIYSGNRSISPLIDPRTGIALERN